MAKQERKYYQYQYDSTAKAYTEKMDPLRIPVPAGPSVKPKTQPRKKVDVRFGFQMSVCCAVIFVCAVSYIYGYATLRVKQTELKSLKDEKLLVNNNITELQAKIDEKLDLSKIEERASNEFGMTKPYAHQVVYIELPEKSYTTYKQTK